ncbi:MAG TPA: AI-2E family transporter [Burkholderiaceae bacterium]|nr:AI-2E family transporter [Burkholderiaceae bacterium]
MAVSPGALTERLRAPLAVKVIAFVALIFLLRTARDVVLPVAIAIILTFLLAPVARMLRNRGLNDALAAAVVVVGLLLTLGFLASRLVEPASEWLARAPTSVQQLIDSYERLRRSIPFMAPPEIALRPTVTTKGRPAAEIVPANTPAPPDPLKDKIAIEGIALTGSLIKQATWVTVSTIATIILLFFFLASERWLMARTVEAIPKRRVRVAVIGGFRAAQRDIARYLGTQAMINAGVGVATTLALMVIGFPSPILWGVIISILAFIPYLGPLLFVALLLLAGTITYTTFGEIIAPAAAYAAINIIESNFIAPWIVGRRLEMSPLFVFLGVMVCAWMWGVAGAFLAVPLLVVIRSAARRSKSLRLWCVYLDRGRPELPTMRALLGIGLRRRRRRAPAADALAASGLAEPRRATPKKPFLRRV